MNVHRVPSDMVGLSKVMPPLSRRGFMSSSAAAAAGYTLAAGPVRADAIKTDTKGLDAGMAKVKVSDGEMPVYFARPQGAANPPIVLVAMEIFGLHEWVKDVTRRLAHLGAFAIAPDCDRALTQLSTPYFLNQPIILFQPSSAASLR